MPASTIKGLGLEGKDEAQTPACSALANSLITREGMANKLPVKKLLRFMRNDFDKYAGITLAASGKNATSFLAKICITTN